MTTKAPIILIGAQRSGTTWFGQVLAKHPQLAYWPEPRHIWTWGHAYRSNDLLTAADASPRIARHIQRTVDQYVRDQGKDRLVEKTPSNCLRIPFIKAIFPDVKFLFIVRDGRSVIRSTSEIMQGGVSRNRVLIRMLGTPPWEWPAYAGHAGSIIARRIRRQPLRFWGPRPPGWKEWVREYPLEVVLAKQWAATIARAHEDVLALAPTDAYVFKYEDLMTRPCEIMTELLDYAELSNAQHMIDHVVNTVDPARQHKWRDEIDDETLELIRPHMEPTLKHLGYQW